MVEQEVSRKWAWFYPKVGVASNFSRALRAHYYNGTPLQGILHPPLHGCYYKQVLSSEYTNSKFTIHYYCGLPVGKQVKVKDALVTAIK